MRSVKVLIPVHKLNKDGTEWKARDQRTEEPVVEALVPLLLRAGWPGTDAHIRRDHLQVMTHKRLDRWCRAAGLRKEAEFDFYDFQFIKRNLYRVLNLATFRLFRSFLTFKVQARYRRLTEP